MDSQPTIQGDVSARRRPKGDKRARTRAGLIEAARSIIRERGYEALTLASVRAS